MPNSGSVLTRGKEIADTIPVWWRSAALDLLSVIVSKILISLPNTSSSVRNV
jgi:hypothetical protein